jgi:hypothetical protein
MSAHWQHKPRDERTIERFAEALSETGKVALAAKAIGITPLYGRTLLARIKAKLGKAQCR